MDVSNVWGTPCALSAHIFVGTASITLGIIGVPKRGAELS